MGLVPRMSFGKSDQKPKSKFDEFSDGLKGLGRVDKRDSLDLRPVIQALLHVGDELGAQPDI